MPTESSYTTTRDVLDIANQVDTDSGPGKVAASPVTSTSPGEVIKWAVGSDGTVLAQTSGQQLAITATQQSDGSVQNQLVFSRAGEAPYLTITSLVQDVQRSLSLTIAAGASQLTLVIAGIDRDVTFGTATVSGSFGGNAVNWTGSVDLSTNPLVGDPIPGWPAKAFAAELATASPFAPLANVLTATEPAPTSAAGAASATHRSDSVWGSISSGLGWAAAAVAGLAGGMIVTAAATPAGVAAGIAVVVLSAFDASLWSEVVQKYDLPDEPDVQPTSFDTSDFDPPVETVQVPVRVQSQDDPPPTPMGQDSAGDDQGDDAADDGDGSGSDGSDGDGSGGGVPGIDDRPGHAQR